MKKKIIKITSVVIIVLVIIFGLFFKINKGNVIIAEIYEVGRGGISEYVEETGRVKSRGQRIIYSTTMGQVNNINVDEGDIVKEGDVLGHIDSEEIELEIKALEAEIQGLQATYKEAIKPVDKSKIDKAEANVESMKANVEEAKRNLINSKKLYEDEAVSLDAYKAAQNNLVVKENSLKIAENELKLLKKGASNNIKNKYEAQIAGLIYKKEILEKKKEDMIIKAPTEGSITEIFIKEGSYVQPSMEMFEIGNIKELYVEVDVLASEVKDIKEGGVVIIYSDDLGINKLEGQVEKVYPKAFSKISDLGIEQKRVKIDVSIPKVSNLKIGYDVDTKFKIRSKTDALIVPDNTVFDIENEKYVFVLEDNKAVLKRVEIGLEGEDFIEVKSGLKEGDRVIISPDEDIEEGVTVKDGKE
ncbi:efflux RND transporter periplasmic adaptor subunit [Paramaledivibacter caminithermalis]|jgi:HlyD family secretion protein|uniref:HlyD family secretion protein n=1 Tax=Paramaledivibacter caminithermalis (strain DSM 15212 / CIP 107654 / DViRD3) TaxID=1121301 RepID=A0A1M6PW81_PARC5|nr:efflux RND transporter periplasmic adaptor subunit [Paramaledivibacter caminithermalis]SHK12235.1 HlyD family secretion protein [Paramaledivibacter caminithermalis DSM 15212]